MCERLYPPILDGIVVLPDGTKKELPKDYDFTKSTKEKLFPLGSRLIMRGRTYRYFHRV